MKKLFLFCAILIFCNFTSCSAQERTQTENAALQEPVHIATWTKSDAAIQDMLNPMLMQDTLYYWNGTWNRDISQWSDSHIYRKENENDTKVIESLGDKQLIYFLVDESHNLYIFYQDTIEEEVKYFFSKQDYTGNEIYNNLITASEEELQIFSNMTSNGYLQHGEVNQKGEVCLLDSNGILFLFNEKGQFVMLQSVWDEGNLPDGDIGLINAGNSGIFLYNTIDNDIQLQKINMTNGSLDTAIALEMSPDITPILYSGYEKGIIISDGNILWSYQPDSNELIQLIDISSNTVNLMGYNFLCIGLLDNEKICALVMLPSSQNAEFVYIDPLSDLATASKQTITLGTVGATFSEKAEKLAADFNKYNSNYQIELKGYTDATALATELLKGQGPDIFQVESTQYHILADNEILENLSPFFEESDVVKQSDLLPAVRNAGTINGKMVFIFSEFTLTGHLVQQGYTQQGSWTPEEFLALGKQYPNASLSPFIDPFQILQFAIQADMDSFIDWQNKKCFFDSERFISLLEQITQITDGKLSADILEWRENKCQWLHDKEILTDRFWIGSVDEYLNYKAAYGDFAEFAGHPNQAATPRYRMETDYVFGINSASENKQGAWIFIEYLLSEEYQQSVTLSDSDTIGAFPVRQDIFDSYLEERILVLKERFENPPSSNYFNMVSLTNSNVYPIVTESDKEVITYMAENAYWDNSLNEILRIISEETGALWAGDKTAQEVAHIIQNRISLILEE